jgi:ACT domain-containing protein
LKFDLTLGLVDRPGQLLKALEPIAKNGGNIISILHEREKTTGGYVPVSLVVDFPNVESFEKTKKELENMGVSVIKSEEIIEKAHITFIMIGKLDIGKIAKAQIEGMRIIDFEASAPTSEEACVKMNVEVPVENVNVAMSKLKKLASEENAVLISSV